MKKAISLAITLCFIALITVPTWAQDSSYQIVLQPSTLSLEVDDTTTINGSILDPDGNTVQDSVAFYSRNSKSVSVSSDGKLKALKPGTFEIIAYAMAPNDDRLTKKLTVDVAYPPVTDIKFVKMPKKVYTKTALSVAYKITDAKGFNRENVEVEFSSSNSNVAYVDQFERLQSKKPGTTTITATAKEVSASWEVTVIENPVTSITLDHEKSPVRTGDVVHFKAIPKNKNGKAVNDAPVQYSFISQTDDNLGEAAAGQIQPDGRFVANQPGLYTITAKSGSAVSESTIRVNARNVQQELQVVGKGIISDVHTSDLWVWEGVDGGDYAITGTWGGNGEAYFWDVSDPANMSIIDTVTVDARTVNDVKISKDGRIGVITREGASDRKNGIVILDVSDPHNVSIISEYTKGLTGGVHNAFIYKDHVFAVNNGRRYDIIDISDPKNPTTVSRFELDTPGHSIHDVWVENGIAYSSNWDDGIVAVDVGSTPAAQSPERHSTGVGSLDNPVKLGSYSYPSGWNHAAFPFKSQSTDDFYVIAGDEAFPNGLNIEDGPTQPAGWIHFVKFEDGWDAPKEVARYQIPEAGTHNFWVKDDTLYIAYYNAGLRIVDISGELMGNLYEQGREIAKHIPTHPEGRISNAAMTWGPQPYKGYIFVSDWNSGIWAYKLQDSNTQGTN
ncbi:Ig-like domain-containing protein [Fodinibius halophilus]|uniref:BIG2 domain-containing protein n=1 Tax=Fodinibius halophilus TaxID=1736908 RepID=A0A6M1TCK8_9BACT|nr:Ig-like domain-containing protein [Fodinibius halophilus]NGP89741.1 hypothetical protein [Fodinibius halophilus]